MLNDLYYYYVTNLYSTDDIKKINSLIPTEPDPELYDIYDKSKKNVGARSYYIKTQQGMLDRFLQKVDVINKRYFGFDVYNPLDHDVYNYNEYNQSNSYAYHLDASEMHSAYDVKLTAILNISTEPHEGGDFFLFDGSEISVPEIKQPGTILVFPSFMVHQVTPVLTGTRKTLSSWFMGPKWR